MTEFPPDPPFWARLLLRRLAEARLPTPLLKWAHARTQTDPSWRAWYHALRTTERAAAGMPNLSLDQKALLRSLVLADIPDGAPEPARSRVLAPVAFAMAAAALFFVVRPSDQFEGGQALDLQARGDGPVIGLYARCVDEARRTVLSEAEAGTGLALRGGRMRCPSGGLVTLAVTNATQKRMVVVVTVIDETGDPQIIALDDGFDVPARSVQQSLPIGVRLGDVGGKGHRAVFASFFEKNPRHGELQAALRSAKKDGIDLRSAARLPVGSKADVRIDVDVGQ